MSLRLAAAALLLPLSACPRPVMVPAGPEQDRDPTISLTYMLQARAGEPAAEVKVTAASGTIRLPSMFSNRMLILTAAGKNPTGGVASLVLKVIDSATGSAITQVENTQTKAADGTALPSLSLIGHDGAGRPGSRGIELAVKRPPQLAEVTATTFTGRRTTIAVTFVADDPPPKITALSASPNNGYVDVGVPVTLQWTVESCITDCQITLTGRDSGGLVLKANHVPPLGGIVVIPTRETITIYKLEVRTAFGRTDREKQVQIWTDPRPPDARPFYFRITIGSFCGTAEVWARDAATARQIAEAESGAIATPITAQEFLAGCPG